QRDDGVLQDDVARADGHDGQGARRERDGVEGDRGLGDARLQPHAVATGVGGVGGGAVDQVAGGEVARTGGLQVDAVPLFAGDGVGLPGRQAADHVAGRPVGDVDAVGGVAADVVALDDVVGGAGAGDNHAVPGVIRDEVAGDEVVGRIVDEQAVV